MDKIKDVAKSTQDFFDNLFHRPDNKKRRNPIEILKRLQRESFSDLMKLRDRQDKVERVLSLYKTSNAGPFQENATRVRGEVDASGAVVLLSEMDQQHYDAVARAGIKSGISSRFRFETSVREKDALVVELVAGNKGMERGNDVSGGALSLSKVLYMANVSDWFSAFAIPVGAQFRDLGFSMDSFSERKGLANVSFVGPPLLTECNGMALGLSARRSNVVALMAHSVSGVGQQPFSDEIGHCFNTFGQIICQFPRGIKLSLFGLHQAPKSCSHNANLGAVAIPAGFLKCPKVSETSAEASAPEMPMPTPTNTLAMTPIGSVAVKLETELGENTKIGSWFEMKNSNPRRLQWAISAFDDSEDELGWGVSFSGTSEGSGGLGRLQGESYAKINLGNKFSLQPGVVYAEDNNARILALMLRSNWFF